MSTEGLELPDSLSRRGFLQLSAMGLLALGLPARWTRRAIAAADAMKGRVLEGGAAVHRAASLDSPRLRILPQDFVFDILGATVGDTMPAYNRVWYEADGLGYVHSSAVQPVRERHNSPLWSVPYRGLLTEVTVPFVDSYEKPTVDSGKVYRLYYGSTYWVNGVSRDVKGHLWYRLRDDKISQYYFARAEALRPIPVSELTPISPEVPLEQKRIAVSLEQQLLTCYEGEELAFISRISSGGLSEVGVYWTPEGQFITFRKRASRHMAAGNLASGYDLPGVPWVNYITDDGVSFHGTYWHNDFGMPRSHGCINMTPQAAKWLYRWTQPIVPEQTEEIWMAYGTQAVIGA
jgi:hypothetical protein